MSSGVVKGNRPLRMFAIMVLVVLLVAQLMGQIDLTELSFLWLLILMALNALQASFSGFCPMFKNAKGECVGCGVVCDDSAAKKSSCCTDDKTDTCCGSEKSSASCCSSDDSNQEAACCSSNECNDAECLQIKVLGTGCKTCDNTVKLIEETAEEMDVKVCVVKVTDVAEIASYAVTSTPGIVINDQVVHSGGMPSKLQVKDWLTAD